MVNRDQHVQGVPTLSALYWLTPAQWLAAWPSAEKNFSNNYEIKGGEDELNEAIKTDPRRLIVLTGKAKTGTSRLAFEISKRNTHVWYPNPLLQLDSAKALSELSEKIKTVNIDHFPMVILDGPNRAESLGLLSELMANVLHPNLKVLIPCSEELAPSVCFRAGSYPTASVMVAHYSGVHRISSELFTGVCAASLLLSYALEGRGLLKQTSAESMLMEEGILVKTTSADQFFCLLNDESRKQLYRDEICHNESGIKKLERILIHSPESKTAIFENIIRWENGRVPSELIPLLTDFSLDTFPNIEKLRASSCLIGGEILDCLVKQARKIYKEDKPCINVANLLVDNARATDEEEALRIIKIELKKEYSIADKFNFLQLRSLIEKSENEIDLLGVLKNHNVYLPLVTVLKRNIQQSELKDLLEEAVVYCHQLITVELKYGSLAAQAAAHSMLAGILHAKKEYIEAVKALNISLMHHGALGNVRGQVMCLYRLNLIQRENNDDRAAIESICDALIIEQTTSNMSGIGYCHWLLGANADQSSNVVLAADHYAAALCAYEQTEHIPERVVTSNQRALRAVKEMSGQNGMPAVPIESLPKRIAVQQIDPGM